MPCEKCGGTVVRSHRRWMERLIFSQTYRCRDCGRRTGESYLKTGLFDEFVSCPRCGNPVPDRRSKPDKVDSMLHTPLRFFHRAFGGRLYHCVFCRLQFYDLRSIKPRPVKETANREPNTAKMAS